jgi:paraquat-inducible protein A
MDSESIEGIGRLNDHGALRSAFEASSIMQIVCHLCRQLNLLRGGDEASIARCGRCGTVIHERKGRVVGRTLLFTLSALVLYVPANTLPILSMEKFGAYSENTIWSGCAALLSQGYWGIALVVFVASILVPLLKMLALLYLAIVPGGPAHRLYKTRVYRIVNAIGPWSMLDVFLVAVLVSLVKLGDLASVSAEPGLAAFAAVVVLTMFASASFDPSIIWDGATTPR